VSRLFMTRTQPYGIEEIRPWIYNAGRLADDLGAKDMKLVITGPPPIFPYDDIRECKLAERESCRLNRNEFVPLVDEVMELLTDLEVSKSNVAVFDIFNAVCPQGDRYCYPDNGTSFLYRDKDHFNSLGSMQLAEPFVDMLRSSGMLSLSD
jgi:hypothetical protein